MDGCDRLWTRSKASRHSSAGIQGLGVPVLMSQAIVVPSLRVMSVTVDLEFFIGVGGLACCSSLSLTGSSPAAIVRMLTVGDPRSGGVLVSTVFEGSS